MRLMSRTFDLDLQTSDDDEYELVIRVATGQLDVEDVRAWPERHTVKV